MFSRVWRLAVMLLALALVGASPAGARLMSSSTQTLYQDALSHPSSYSAAQLHALDISRYPLLGTHTLPDGGTSYDYRVSQHGIFHLLKPPAGFNPVTASEKELALYSIPSRPSPISPEYQTWMRLHSKFPKVSPGPKVLWVGHRSVAAHSHKTYMSEFDFAGMEARTANYLTHQYSGIDTDITIPSGWHPNTSAGYPQDVSLWGGIGVNGGILNQNGFELQATSSTALYQWGWVEIVGLGGAGDLLFTTLTNSNGHTVHAGDTFESQAQFTSTAATGDLINQTENWAYPYTYTLNSTQLSASGTDSEVQAEKDAASDPIPNFGTFNVTNAYTYYGWPYASSISHAFGWYPDSGSGSTPYKDRIWMKSNAGTMLIDVGSTFGTQGQNFNLTWKASS